MSVSDVVLDQLAQITGDEEVKQNLDLRLFEENILDSLGMVELIVALGETLNLQISPAQIDRQMWATPRKIIADIEARLQK
ncbi:MAG: D-alanine--poly(phosphoribitol) ligase subunit DltC [Anaerolineaceae bacterium]|jgi:D-alanine--poly(phosphoribitol) ligase subunit 2